MNIADGMTWLSAKKFEQDGIAVTYSRGETDVAITAIRGRTNWESEDSESTLITMEAPDYFVLASAIVALGEPQRGDRITDAGNVFEVMSPGGEHHCQWTDAPNRTVYRIHTKQVDTA